VSVVPSFKGRSLSPRAKPSVVRFATNVSEKTHRVRCVEGVAVVRGRSQLSQRLQQCLSEPALPLLLTACSLLCRRSATRHRGARGAATRLLGAGAPEEALEDVDNDEEQQRHQSELQYVRENRYGLDAFTSAPSRVSASTAPGVPHICRPA
jgi:hypothetical protein